MYEVIDSLRASDYAASLGKTDACGLRDPSAVGVRQEAFTTVRYPVPADNEVGVVINVSEFGITPDAADNSAALRELLTRVSEMQGSVKLVFPVGTYRFNSTLNFYGLTDLYVCSYQPGRLSQSRRRNGPRVSGCRIPVTSSSPISRWIMKPPVRFGAR